MLFGTKFVDRLEDFYSDLIRFDLISYMFFSFSSELPCFNPITKCIVKSHYSTIHEQFSITFKM